REPGVAAAMSAPVAATATFRIRALPREAFEPLFALDDAALAARGMRRVTADSRPGFPCRVSLVDAVPGETLLLLHHVPNDVPGPCRAAGPIYVREHAATAAPVPGDVPELLRVRLLSLRAYDDSGWLLDADVVDGRELEHAIERLFADRRVAY